MSATVTVRKIGNSLGVILPKGGLGRLRLGQGDKLFLTETADGLLLTPYDERFGKQVESAERFMSEYRDTLRELAK